MSILTNNVLMQQYRQYNTQYPRTEIIGGVLYDTVVYASGVTVTLNVFNALRASPDLSNMIQPSQLPSPTAFLIRAVRFKAKVFPFVNARAASGAVCTGIVDDIAQLVNTGTFTFTVGNKPYLNFPLWMLPEGGGIFGTMAAEGDAASPGETVQWGSNGVPMVDNVFSLTKPLFLAPQVNFIGVLLWPAALTLAGGNTQIMVTLDGDMLRPVQ